jgi:four helix bundle protein
MSAQGLKKLQVWVRAKDFAVRIYKQILPLLPPEEKWSLGQQIRRSSVSVSANIAEGYGRFYYQDNVRFCYNARGSLEETLSHLIFSFEVNFIPAELYYTVNKVLGIFCSWGCRSERSEEPLRASQRPFAIAQGDTEQA